MTIMQAWRALRQDPDWVKKAGTAVLVNLIPYVGSFLVLGFAVNYASAAARGTDRGRLPEWGAFGDHARSALHAFVVSLVYALPLMLVVMPASFVFAFGIAASAEGEGGAALFIATSVFVLFVTLLSFAWVPVSYAGFAALIATGRMDGAFAFRDVWARARRNARLLIATSARIVGLGLLGALPLFAVGLPAFIAAISIADSGRAGAAMAMSLGMTAYFVSLAVVIAFSAVVQLVAYRMLAEYARVAYGIEPPPVASVA